VRLCKAQPRQRRWRARKIPLLRGLGTRGLLAVSLRRSEAGQKRHRGAGSAESKRHTAPMRDRPFSRMMAGRAIQRGRLQSVFLYPASDQDRPHHSTFRTHRQVLRLGLGLIYPDLGIFALNAGFRTVDRPNTFCRVI
jgi:hypothetical protein